MLIKMMPACRALLPVFSEGRDGGRVLLREEYCMLPKGHLNHHRSISGAVLANDRGTIEAIERGKL